MTYKCSAKIISYKLTAGQIEIQIPSVAIQEFAYTTNYDNAVFPVCYVDVLVTYEQLLLLKKYQTDIKISLQIDIAYSNSINNDLTRSSFSFPWIKNTFKCDLNQTTDVTDFYNNVKDPISNVAKWSDLNTSQNVVRLYLQSIFYNTALTDTSNVLTNCTITDCVKYLTQVGKFKNFYVAPFNNTTVFNQIIIPRGSVYKNLIFLDNTYGLYEDGSIIFIDLDKVIIYPANYCQYGIQLNNVKCTNLNININQNTEYPLISINSVKSRSVPTVHIPSLTTSDIIYEPSSTDIDYIKLLQTTLTTIDNLPTTTIAQANAKTQDIEKNKWYIDGINTVTTKQKYLKNQILRRIYESKHQIVLSLPYIDPWYFEPILTFTFNNTKIINGKFRLNSKHVALTKMTENIFNINLSIAISKLGIADIENI